MSGIYPRDRAGNDMLAVASAAAREAADAELQRRARAAAHQCHAIACREHVPPEKLMCKKHWFMVPPGIRKRVLMFYTPGQCTGKASIKPQWFDAADAAIASVFNREAPTILRRVKLPAGYTTDAQFKLLNKYTACIVQPDKPALMANLVTGEVFPVPLKQPSDEDPGDAQPAGSQT